MSPISDRAKPPPRPLGPDRPGPELSGPGRTRAPTLCALSGLPHPRHPSAPRRARVPLARRQVRSGRRGRQASQRGAEPRTVWGPQLGSCVHVCAGTRRTAAVRRAPKRQDVWATVMEAWRGPLLRASALRSTGRVQSAARPRGGRPLFLGPQGQDFARPSPPPAPRSHPGGFGPQTSPYPARQEPCPPCPALDPGAEGPAPSLAATHR